MSEVESEGYARPYNDWLADELRNKVLWVTFTKVSGTKRRMLCTLMPEKLPEWERDEAINPLPSPGDRLAVWDLENEGWRSFRYSSVIQIELSDEED